MPYLDSVASRSRFVITWVSELLNGIIKRLAPTIVVHVRAVGRAGVHRQDAQDLGGGIRAVTVDVATIEHCDRRGRIRLFNGQACTRDDHFGQCGICRERIAAEPRCTTNAERSAGVEFLRRIGFPESDPIECPRSISLMQGTRRRPRTQSGQTRLSHAAARYACSSYGRQRPTQCNT